MRGKETFVAEKSAVVRITPAYAGKSLRSRSSSRRSRDHPRVCGEKFDAGSDHRVASGITPAYAGKRNMFSETRPRT